ncbi:MAG: inositol monophosphatase, partial [Propionibacterium sp.]
MDTDTVLKLLDEVAETVIRPKFRALAQSEVEQKA